MKDIINVTLRLGLEDNQIASFYQDMHDAMDPTGSVSIVYKEDELTEFNFTMPYNYRILFESFIEKWFGKDGYKALIRAVKEYELALDRAANM